jgi:uncharacterized protein with FMN-binding domain
MAKKMPRGLVALSSSAVAAIYLAGFVHTQGADAGLVPVATSVPTTATASPSAAASGSSQPASAPATSTAVTTSTAVPTATPAATSTPVATSTSTTTSTTSAYRDGTYTGSGTSRRGGVNVSVTIQSGRIASVTITSVSTQYPVSRISALPAQVVARQSGQVDNVSGATYSAQAFSLAVQAALTKAGA